MTDADGLRDLVDSLRAELAQERMRGRSRDLARAALSQLDVDPERALLLALQANEAALTYESRDAMQEAVFASRLRWVFTKPNEARIVRACFSHDNRHIITAGDDGVLRWWDMESKREMDALSCCSGPIEKLHLSPRHDRALVIARRLPEGPYRRIIVDLSERKVAANLDGAGLTEDDAATASVFFSQDGSRLVIGTQEGTDLSVFDATSGVRLYQAEDVGLCHGIDREGKRAILTRCDLSVAIVPFHEDRAVTLSLPTEQVTVTSFCDIKAGPMPFSAEGGKVTLGTTDRVACVWNAEDGSLLHVLGHETPCHGSTASFTPSGRYITVQQNDSVATELWEAETGKMIAVLPHSSAFQTPLRFLHSQSAPDAVEHAIVGMGAAHYSWPLQANQVSEWQITSGKLRTHFHLPSKRSFERCFTADGSAVHWPLHTHQDDISFDGNWVLRLEDDVVSLFARVESAEPDPGPAEPGASCTSDRRINWSSTGKSLVDAQTNQELAQLGMLDRFVFSGNGQFLAATSHAEVNPAVRIWDARTGRLRFTIDTFAKRITAMQFQPGRNVLLLGSMDRTIRLWSLDAGAELARATVETPEGPSYETTSSSDGMKIAFATSGRMQVWHVGRGEIVHAPTLLYARAARFSSDGAWLLAADEDVARIWETATMKPLSEFRLHFASIVSGDLSPDKKLAATCGLDQCARLWEPLTGREITRWRLPDGIQYHQHLRFTDDGACLRAPGGRRLIVAMEQLLSLARSRVFRELREDERRLFCGA